MDKTWLLNTYLQQQHDQVHGLIKPDEITLEEFKECVKKWMEADQYIRKAKQLCKEKRRYQNKLSEDITRFMCCHNIEDLNMKEGRIRCKTTYVRKPVTHKEIKEKVARLVPDKSEMVKQIFEERPKQEKVGLRRLKFK